jgi:hypothetical protein
LGALGSPIIDAMLYSVDSMTTRGASGLMLQRHWQMMGALEAADGMLLFAISAISTAYIFALMQVCIGRCSEAMTEAAPVAAKTADCVASTQSANKRTRCVVGWR